MAYSPSVFLRTSAGVAIPIYGGSLSVVAQDYLQSLSEGDIAGHTPFIKFGYNDDVGATEEDIWTQGAVYAFPASAIQMEVVSANANDTVAGSGVQKVRVSYLDNTYASQTETISLNGTTPVATVATNILRVNALRATQVGANKVAAGLITCRMIGGAVTVYRAISAGLTRGRGAIYTVPLGKTLYLTSIAISSGFTTSGKLVRWTGRATFDDLTGGVLNFFQPFFEHQTQDSGFYRPFEMPVKIPATADLKISALSDNAGSRCTCALRGWTE
jgi:hypothetical protein